MTAEIKLQDKPVAYTLLEHSLRDNPPNIVFRSSHFVTHAIEDSPELAAIVQKIVSDHIPITPGASGICTGDVAITFASGDLHAGINNASLYYNLRINADHTYSISMFLKDRYDFALSQDYLHYSVDGIGITVANNLAWADQHAGIVENYWWFAELRTQNGVW